MNWTNIDFLHPSGEMSTTVEKKFIAKCVNKGRKYGVSTKEENTEMRKKLSKKLHLGKE